MFSKMLPSEVKWSTSWLPDIVWTWQYKLAASSCTVLGVTMLIYLRRLYRERGMPPGPADWRFWTSMFATESFEDVMEKSSKYGEVTSVKDTYMTMIVLNSYSAIKEAYLERDDFSYRGFPAMVDFVLDDMQDDIFHKPFNKDTWIANKSKLASCFRSSSFGRGGTLEDKVLEQIQIVTSSLESYVHDEEPVDFIKLIPKITANIILHVLLSISYDYDSEELQHLLNINHDAYQALEDGLMTPVSCPLWMAPYLHRKQIASCKRRINVFREFFRKEIRSHIETFDAEHTRDFVDLYWAKTLGEHSEDRMVDNTWTFMPDAIESTGTGFQWLIHNMAYYPDVQEKVAKEIETVTGGNRAVTWADKASLPYTEATIMEIIRLHPVISFLGSRRVGKDTIFRGYRIPVGVDIYGNLAAVNMDPDIYPEPKEFKPERYLDNNGKIGPAAKYWIPFSMGTRKCMGEAVARMEWFLLISNIVQRYILSFPPGVEGSLETRAGTFSKVPVEFKILLKDRQ